MIDRLLRDIEVAPDLFHWSGPVPRGKVLDAVRDGKYVVPDALLSLWEDYGVLDMFETETILSPTDHGYDGLAEMNAGLRDRGMPSQYLVFHTGLFLSAIRQSDGAVLQVDEVTFAESDTYASLQEWYERGIRNVYQATYGLPDTEASR